MTGCRLQLCKRFFTVGENLLRIVTFPPFIDPAGMLGFLLLASPESVDLLDGKEAFQ